MYVKLTDIYLNI